MSHSEPQRPIGTKNRFSFVVGAALLLAAASSVAQTGSTAGLPDLKGKSFVFGGLGGDLQKNEDAAWLKPFAAATGAKISQTDSPDLARLQLQQQAKNVGVDVIQIESSTVDAGCSTVFMAIPLDRSQLNSELDSNKCGVPVVKFSFVLAYNAKAFPTAPTSVADFYNVQKFPGRRGAANNINNGIIEVALLADGVARAKLYPLDIDRALKKASGIKSSIDFKGSFALLQDALISGDLPMAVLPNGRALNAAKANPDIKVVFKNAVTLYDNLAVPVGAKNVEAATAFLQYTAKHATQIALTERFPYGTGTKGPAPQLTEPSHSFFPDTYAAELLVRDNKSWSTIESTLQQRWLDTFSK